MKKLILLFAVLFSLNSVFAQAFKPVKLDSLVTISMPAAYSEKDTLGQHIYTVNSDLGYMVTIRQANAKGNEPLKKEKDLNSVLKKYVSGIQKQSGNGSAQFVRDTTIGNLKAKAFTLITDDGSGNISNRDFVLLYTKEATYTFEFGFADSRKELVKEERKAYFSSIKLSPQLQRDDQYTDTSAAASSVNTSLIIEIAAGALVVFALVWLIFFRKRNRVSIE